MIRDTIKTALVTAMKGGDKASTATIRLIQSAIKNRDIELRTGTAPADDDALVTEVLQKMIKQRRESVTMYRQGNREELAAQEESEIAVIERFLPAQLSDEEASAKVKEIIAELGASSMKDMGRVMAAVKERLGTSIEPARASGLVKTTLPLAIRRWRSVKISTESAKNFSRSHSTSTRPVRRHCPSATRSMRVCFELKPEIGRAHV